MDLWKGLGELLLLLFFFFINLEVFLTGDYGQRFQKQHIHLYKLLYLYSEC